ncbi:nucleoside transporter C-terminal domain-containing protein [Saccharopolyspora shandongensis]|uniref:nucleoside transporter C-terminal domain-containing protein n=1 Tax=Saccharopolyspora shandongensis TaxID=418495 RepID=UPI0033C21F60
MRSRPGAAARLVARIRPQIGQFSEKSATIITFALTGFANFGSLAILLGGLGAAGSRRTVSGRSWRRPWRTCSAPPSRGSSSDVAAALPARSESWQVPPLLGTLSIFAGRLARRRGMTVCDQPGRARRWAGRGRPDEGVPG